MYGFGEMGLDNCLIRVYSVCQQFWRNGSEQQSDQGLHTVFANSFGDMGLDSSLIRVYSVCQQFWRNGSGQQSDQGLQCLPTVLEKWVWTAV